MAEIPDDLFVVLFQFRGWRPAQPFVHTVDAVPVSDAIFFTGDQSDFAQLLKISEGFGADNARTILRFLRLIVPRGLAPHVLGPVNKHVKWDDPELFWQFRCARLLMRVNFRHQIFLVEWDSVHEAKAVAHFEHVFVAAGCL